MRSVWHLAINSLAGRKLRTALLVLAITLSTTLIIGVCAAAGTMQASVQAWLGQMTGLTDMYVSHAYGGRVPTAFIEDVRQWDGVEIASPRFETTAKLLVPSNYFNMPVVAVGVDPVLDAQVHPVSLAEGRAIERRGEAVIDEAVARTLDVGVGDDLQLRSELSRSRIGNFGRMLLRGLTGGGATESDEPQIIIVEVRIVGILERPSLPIMQRPMAMVAIDDAWSLVGTTAELSRIDVVLRDGVSLDAMQAAHNAALPAGTKLMPTPANSSGIKSQIRANRLMLLLLTLLVFLSSSFMIVTGLTTSVIERLHELAVLRCIGASRMQIALSQLLSGLLLSVMGILIGGPLGMFLAWRMFVRYAEMLPAGFKPDLPATAAAVGVALLSGLLAAAYPAIRASNVQPLSALAARSQQPTRRGIAWCTAVALMLIGFAWFVLVLPIDPSVSAWVFMVLGMGPLFIGMFLLSVPLLVLLATLLAAPISLALRVPSELLKQSVLGTPYRHGFTGGALMVGVALLVFLSMGSRSVMSQWFEQMRIPDGFACKSGFMGLLPMTDAELAALRDAAGVTEVCATAAFPVTAPGAQFGVKELSPRMTLYVSFEPDSFFRMARIDWLQGDEATATKRLNEGRALLVSREYLEAHGLGLGDQLTLETPQGPVDFDIAGVIASQGLEVVVQRFGIHRYYNEASIASVFGPRQDAIRYFNNDQANLMLLSFDPAVDDRQVQSNIRKAVPGAVTGSARQIRRQVERIVNRVVTVASTVALGTLLIACFGVGNIIIANIASRRFEYGVLRAVGAQRWLIGRIVLGETVLLALAGSACGCLLGVMLAMMLRVFHHRLLGVVYRPVVPWDVMLWGTAIAVGLALLAAMPAVMRLVWTRPRALLA